MTLTPEQKLGIAGLLTAPIGYLVLLFLPVYLEVVTSSLSLTDQQIGYLASSDSLGVATATLLFAIFIQKLKFRPVALAGITITITSNLFCALISNIEHLLLLRVIAGFGEGLIVAVGISAIGMTSNPNRWFGFYTAVIVFVQATGLLVVPNSYFLFGLPGVFVVIALLYLLPLAVVRMLPEDSNAAEQVEQEHPQQFSEKIKAPLFLAALVGLLCFYIGIGATWSYVSFMGTEQDLSLQYVSMALSLSMILGFLGALFFASADKIADKQWLFLLSITLMSVSIWALLTQLTETKYLVILSVFSFFWSIVGARTFAIISDADHSGKYISAAQTLVGVGYIIGPSVAAGLVSQHGYAGVNGLTTAVFVLCFVLMTPLVLKVKQLKTESS